MPLQEAFTVIANIRPEAREGLEGLLAEMDADPANNSVLPFARLKDVHFARLVILPEGTDRKGKPIPAKLALETNVDSSIRDHMARLVDTVPDSLDRVFGHCEGYPPSAPGTRQERLRFLEDHSWKPQAFYINTVGRGVEQVLAEDLLRRRLEDMLDAERRQDGFAAMAPSAIHQQMRKRVQDSPDLRWATKPVAGRSLLGKLKYLRGKLGWPIVFAGVGIASLPVLPLYIVGLRFKEITDKEDVGGPTLDHIRKVSAYEDRYAMNPFSGVGNIKSGLIRKVTARVGLRLIDYGAKYIYNNGHLTGVTTIHFARWIIIDDGRRVLFLSNYDGSLESYMSDFIDKVAWGLNLVFSNGEGWPKTRWLIFGGAKKEIDFKNFLRSRQVPTQVYYSAYPHLTAVNIANSAAIRRGLTQRSMNDKEAQAWLDRF